MKKARLVHDSIHYIQQELLSRIRSLLPTLAEQEAIAEALSDADALIEALEGLIAKKRQVKQGAMQELLTGKRRLQSFSGKGYKQTKFGIIPEDWEIKHLTCYHPSLVRARRQQHMVMIGKKTVTFFEK